MKNILKVFVLLIFPLAMMASVGAPGDDIVNAFKNGNARTVASFFDSSVDISIEGKDNTYSKSQAEQVLNSFFSEHKASGFKVLHNVTSPDNTSQSIVGQYSSNGKNYRVNIVMAKASGKEIIQEITIRNR